MTQGEPVLNRSGLALGRILDLLLPPQCLLCDGIVAGDSVLCPDCWGQVVFLSPPQCAVCGLPFEFEAGCDVACGACTRHPPPYRRARAVISYDEISRKLLLGFKHGDRTDATPSFARWLLRAGADLLDANDTIVPVPLHWTRLFARRYNQAALLGRQVARVSGLPFAPEILVRTRRTASQGHLRAPQRRDNVRGAFAVPQVQRDRIEGQRVLLIDDVITTGATISACTRALTAAGAASVDVLALARVARPAPELPL